MIRAATPSHGVECDERWMAEWVTFGLREMLFYLEKQSRFSDYLKERERRP